MKPRNEHGNWTPLTQVENPVAVATAVMAALARNADELRAGPRNVVELARVMGVPHSTLARRLRGERPIQADVAAAMMAATGQ